MPRHAEQVERAARVAKRDLAGLDGGGLLAAQEPDPRTLQAGFERSAADLAQDWQADRSSASSNGAGGTVLGYADRNSRRGHADRRSRIDHP